MLRRGMRLRFQLQSPAPCIHVKSAIDGFDRGQCPDTPNSECGVGKGRRGQLREVCGYGSPHPGSAPRAGKLSSVSGILPFESCKSCKVA
jgi:hypothetical protein